MPGQKAARRLLSPFHWRMLVLASAMLAMLAAIAIMAHRTWTQTAAVRERFQAVHQQSVWLGHRVSDAVHLLDSRMLRFKLGAGPGELRKFQEELDALKNWLDEQRPGLHTPQEVDLLARLDREIAGYDASAHAFATTTTLVPTDGAVSLQIADLSQRSKAIAELGFALANAHQATVENVFAMQGRENAQIQWSMFAALGLVLCVGTGMGWVVYRDSIAPMRRTLQENRRQLARQEKLAALGEMSAAIAHEIRNPLTALKARVFTLRKCVAADSSAAEDARVINDEIDRLERIVREFLRFVRPPEPVLAAVNPIDLLRHVCNLVAPEWTKSGVRVELEETSAPAMRADRDLIEQALLNLVINAAQAITESGTGGRVRLRAVLGEHPQTGARREGVRLEVADDGPGVPPEIQGRLFDPFFSTKPTGTGLGLALTARIAEKHEGRVEFDTTPGRGTTFALLLPLAAA